MELIVAIRQGRQGDVSRLVEEGVDVNAIVRVSGVKVRSEGMRALATVDSFSAGDKLRFPRFVRSVPVGDIRHSGNSFTSSRFGCEFTCGNSIRVTPVLQA